MARALYGPIGAKPRVPLKPQPQSERKSNARGLRLLMGPHPSSRSDPAPPPPPLPPPVLYQGSLRQARGPARPGLCPMRQARGPSDGPGACRAPLAALEGPQNGCNLYRDGALFEVTAK